ncbi:hypothetical protein GCM10017744_000060 [Streptomyces antimycoticus]|uniref:hypothetical protein n=1 Tax=Streptomyces antimycoticus TaxID=68175 RepID=UPI0031EF6BF8
MAEKERRVMEWVRRMHELMRNHTKAELVGMAYAGGLVRFNSPEKWRKDEIASSVVDIELWTAVQPDQAWSAEETTPAAKSSHPFG